MLFSFVMVTSSLEMPRQVEENQHTSTVFRRAVNRKLATNLFDSFAYPMQAKVTASGLCVRRKACSVIFHGKFENAVNNRQSHSELCRRRMFEGVRDDFTCDPEKLILGIRKFSESYRFHLQRKRHGAITYCLSG